MVWGFLNVRTGECRIAAVRTRTAGESTLKTDPEIKLTKLDTPAESKSLVNTAIGFPHKEALAPRSHACKKALGLQRKPAADNQIHQYRQAGRLRTMPLERRRRRFDALPTELYRSVSLVFEATCARARVCVGGGGCHTALSPRFVVNALSDSRMLYVHSSRPCVF